MIFKPSQIRCATTVLPFCGSRFGRAELEFAAAILVRACALNGNTWEPRTGQEITDAWEQESLDGGIFAHLRHNPFRPKPDFSGLADSGFALFIATPTIPWPIQFTARGLEALEPFGVEPFAPRLLVGI